MKKFVNYDTECINGITYVKGTIYKFRNLINDKVYIGQTIQERIRYNNHLCKCHNKYPIDNAIKKYGIENFEYSILENCYSLTPVEVKDKLDILEINYIKQYNSTDKEKGYNLSIGGKTTRDTTKQSNISKGHIVTEETRQKISIANKGRKITGEWLQHIREAAAKRRGKPANISEEGRKRKSEKLSGSNHPMYGKHHTKEAKEKISKAHKGKVYDKPDTWLPTIQKILIARNKSEKQIKAVKAKLKGKPFTETHRNAILSKNTAQIDVYKNGALLYTYQTLKDCVNDLYKEKHEVSKASIERMLHGQYVEKYKEYEFKYHNNIPTGFRTIYQYDLDGCLVKKWLKISDCKRAGYNRDKIIQVCRNQKSEYAGYFWSFTEKQIEHNSI